VSQTVVSPQWVFFTQGVSLPAPYHLLVLTVPAPSRNPYLEPTVDRSRPDRVGCQARSVL
jgi:hypothetical protein